MLLTWVGLTETSRKEKEESDLFLQPPSHGHRQVSGHLRTETRTSAIQLNIGRDQGESGVAEMLFSEKHMPASACQAPRVYKQGTDNIEDRIVVLTGRNRARCFHHLLFC